MGWVAPPGYRVCPPRINITNEVLDKNIARGLGDAPALVWQEGRWSYRRLDQEVCRMAAGLKQIGVKRDDVVLFRCRNVPLACAAILATYKIGAVTALTSTLLRDSELAAIAERAKPRVAVTLNEVASPIRSLVGKGHVEQAVLLDDAPAAKGEISAREFRDAPETSTVDTESLAPALLFYSSGTTGRPKGVLHSHRWIAAMGDVIRLQMEYATGDVVMTPGEFSFMATWGHCFVVPLLCGATVGLYAGRPQPRAVLEAVASLGVNKFMAVPTFFRTALANEEIENGLDLSRMTIWVSGGEALGTATIANWQRRFGKPLYDMYGITEMQVVIANGPAIVQKPGSIGQLLPGVQISLRDDGLNEVPVGQPGKAMVHRSDPGLFLEYYNDWEKWRSAHRGDYYDTGDVMRRDEDGYFWYLGRQDDLFKTRGMFVSPGEVEDALLRNPAVAEAAVVGLPDDRIGNRVVAYAVLRTGVEPTAALAGALLSAAANVLAPYKVPEEIKFVPQLPKSVVGKIMRRALRSSA